MSDKPTLILIGIRGLDDVFVSLKNETLWKNKVIEYYKKKKFISMYKEIKKGPFWTMKMNYDKINLALNNTMWNSKIFTYNCISLIFIS